VEKAKDVLIRRRNINGEDAYRWIQKRSMDSRKSMREVAEAVLLSEEL
jgi:AmiR/NasT family two-component response regulator